MQVLGDLGGVVAARALDAVGDDLGGRVGGHLERAAGVALLGFECLHDVGVGGVLGEVGRQRQQHAFDGVAGDGVDVGVARAFRTHPLGLHALLGGLAQQQAHFRVVAAVVHEVDALGLELGDDGRVVAVAGVDAFEDRDGHAALFEVVLDRRGDALAVRLLVVQHGDLLRLDLFQDELGGGRALLVVAADGAEDELVILAVGQRRRRGRRRDHDDAFVVVDVGGGDGGARAHMAHDETDLAVDDTVGGDRPLLGFAAVVDHDGFKLLAVDAAGGVDAFHGRINPFTDHVAILSDRAGGGAYDADLDGLRVGGRAKRQTSGDPQRCDDRGQTKYWLHEWTPRMAFNRWYVDGADAGNPYMPALSRCICRASIH
ncbi:hypothetical protein D3C85_721620 [compost metagenome]